MADDTRTQASGGGADEGRPDGVENPGGKSAGGESAGGAYPDPGAGRHRGEDGFMGHGGQGHIDYSGTGDDDGEDNKNAATGAD